VALVPPIAAAAPAPAPAAAPIQVPTPSVVLPPLSLAAPSRPVAGVTDDRPKGQDRHPNGERVFPGPKVAVVSVLGISLYLLAAFMTFWAGSAVLDLFAGGSGLKIVSNGFFILVCLALAGAMGAQGRALLRMRVVMTPTELVAHGRFIRVQRTRLDEIYSIRLGQRPMSALLGERQTVDVPYVQRQDGSGFWLDALGGISSELPPTAPQLEMFDQISALIEQSRSVSIAH